MLFKWYNVSTNKEGLQMKKYTLKEIDSLVRGVVRGDVVIDENHDFVKPVKERLIKRYGDIVKEHTNEDIANNITSMCEQYETNYSIDIYDALEVAGMTK